MEHLYATNTLGSFWGVEPEVPVDVWRAAVHAAVGLLPDAADALGRGGWDGLMEHILGEGQFGPDRYRLSHLKWLYYQLKPALPRPLTAMARGRCREQQLAAFCLGWPIEDRYVSFLYRVLECATNGAAAPVSPGPTPLGPHPAYRVRGFWPEGAHFAFVLTHDVERADGQAFVRTLADLDERYGFRSSFNFVPEDYPVDLSLLRELRARGFEVGVHGLKHDGRLFSSRVAFEAQVGGINRYLREWGAVGFRAPFVHRNPEWMQALEVEYDLSCFDTDPFEPMPGGTMSIWPFFCGRFVELPYTLAQDHTLLVVLGQRTPRLWLDKVEFIARWGGMALVNVHPDYLRVAEHARVYEAFLQAMAARRERGAPGYWHALPREVARWWRARAGAAAPGSRGAGEAATLPWPAA